jgi:hypothetical protein
VLLYKVGNIFHGKHLVEDAFGLNNHNRALCAEALAASGNYLDLFREAALFNLSFKRIADLKRTIGNTTCAGANQKLRPAGLR